MSAIEERVIEKIRQRAERGLEKYGVTMERGDLNLMEWITHTQEEMLDGAIYLERLKDEFQKKIDIAVEKITEEIMKKMNDISEAKSNE